MRKILTIARREYAETVRTKAFLLSIFMAPLMVAGIIYFTHRLEKDVQAPRPSVRVTVVDRTGRLAPLIESRFAEYEKSPDGLDLTADIQSLAPDQDAELDALKDRVLKRRLDALMVVSADIFTDQGTLRLYTRPLNPNEFDLTGTLRRLVNQAVIDQRCRDRNVDRALLNELNRWVPFEETVLSPAGPKVQEEAAKVVNMMIPFFFMFMIFMGVFAMGQYMLTNVIEEKSSRVIEILLSSVTPFELLAGKIAGLSAVGLSVMTLWGGSAWAAALWRGLDIQVGPAVFLYFVVYYILGYVLFSSLLAGIGSTCNTLKEAQSLMVPVNFLFVIPMMSWFNMVQNPNGTLSRVLSWFPFTSPMVMVLRLAASDATPLYEIAGTIAMLLIVTPLTIWLSARIFRTGILMYGKRPTPLEILRWIRQG